jgi:hypothetical protein
VITVTVNPPCNLHTGFTFNSAGDPKIVFTNTSTGASLPYYSWDFGDGSYSYDANPTHTFQYSGMHMVCLTVYDSLNWNCYSTYCDSFRITNAVTPPCNALFYSYQDSSNVFHFSDASTGGSNYWHWTFGDGSDSYSHNPTHHYAQKGTFSVCLTIYPPSGYGNDSCIYCTNVICTLSATGIQENSISVNSVFPNPANDMLEVSFSQFVMGDFTITDMTGREVYQEKINTNNVRVDVSNLQVGCYNLSIVSGSKIIHRKIMIAR